MQTATIIEEKKQKVIDILKEMGSVLIAFSGGTDSSLLAALAAEALGRKTALFLGVSASLPQTERESAIQFAGNLNVPLIETPTQELENAAYRNNDRNRCYHCKTILFQQCRQVADSHSLEWIADGLNVDDLSDYRPGSRAAQEAGVRHPLQEAGLTKADIRQLSKQMNLVTWDKPAAACLASRIPYGIEVSAERLSRIEQVEHALHELGFNQVRARFHDPVLRIETSSEELDRFLRSSLREKVIEVGENAGFKYITLDLKGYRTGSLNEVLGED